MQKHYSLLSGLFLAMLLISSLGVNAQNIQLQSFTFPSLPATSCTNTQLNVSVLRLCINAAHNGNSFSISGSTITVSLDYTLGPICLGALSQNVESINLGMIPAGTYSVVIQGVLNSTAVSTLNTTLTVASCCSATSGFTPSKNKVCAGDSAHFINTSIGATSQTWYENNVMVSTNTNYGKVYTTPGTYNVKLVITGVGCSDSTTKTVQVNSTLPTIDLGPDQSICPDAQVVLDAGAGRDSIKWSDQSSFRSLIVTSPGTYYVEVFKNGCSNMDTVVVSLYNVKDVELGNDTIICAGDTLELDASLTGAIYQWQNNSTKSSFSVFGAGTYHVERTDTNGCKARDTIVVSIDTTCNPSGLLKNKGYAEVSVFPNPAKHTLAIELPIGTCKIFTLTIFDISGKLIKSERLEVDNAGRLIINVSQIHPGIYTLSLLSEDENYIARWVKE